MLTVAIASENDAADGEVYRYLLERLLDTHVERWKTDISFNGGGFRRVHSLMPKFLTLAAGAGVSRALVAIDNDGGSMRSPEHEGSHEPARDGAGEKGCRVCWLSQRVPESWGGASHRACIVVPVQTLETWLLVLRGHDFGGKSPERVYYREGLKREFYGQPLPPSSRRTELALAQLRRPEALEMLRERPSFQLFAQQLRGW